MIEKILIADDHSIVRTGIKNILQDSFGKIKFGEAGNGFEVLDLVGREEYDAILLDISMPKKNGLDTLKDLKSRASCAPVLIVSMHPESHYALRSLRAGAAGYLEKASAPEELVKALDRITNGGRYISSELAEQMALQLSNDEDKPLLDSLSDREFEVMKLIAEGRSLSEISAKLFISEKTVSTYRRRILLKLHLNNNVEIARFALESGIVA